MVVLSAENLSKAYGTRVLFEGVTFGLTREDRVGLIGVNGAGKSTLLRILLGEEKPDDGRVAVARGAVVEYVAQEPDLDGTKTALEVMLKDGPEAFQVVEKYEAACRRLSEDPADEERIAEVGRLTDEMNRVDGWNLESEALMTLSRLGIHDREQPVGSMSGGEQKRVALARALVRPSDLLILDEPTNHLDIEAVSWLEGFLSRRAAGLMLITHDRYFLDRVTNGILELADRQVYRHKGTYSDFLVARQEREDRERVMEHRRAQLAKKELEWLRRGPKARTTKNKARVQRAEALQEPSSRGPEQELELNTVESRLGKKVIELHEVTASRGGDVLVRDFTYFVERRDRLGIVGPNGVGKSTLLDLVAGRLKAESGQVEVGETVVVGYYDQRAMDLDEETRVHDYITEVAHRIPTPDGWLSATQMLDRFLFDREKQWTVIGKLSGGERRRLYLLRVLMARPNVLLLDEPTNDLDVDTLTVLEDYLDSFDGAVVAVSHDRYFLDRTMEHLLLFRGGGEIEEIPGNYSYLEERLARERKEAEAARAREEAEVSVAASDPEKGSSPRPRKLTYSEQKELDGMEERIADLEGDVEDLERRLAECGADYEETMRLDEKRRAAQGELDGLLERWMELSEIAESSQMG